MCHLFTASNGECKGYGIITFISQIFRDTALLRKFFSRTRQIKVQEYISDSAKLDAIDQEEGKFKVCVLGIPKYLESSRLETLL